MLVPTVFDANVAVAPVVLSVTASMPITPFSAAEPLFRSDVAAVVASYTLLLAVIPVMVSAFAVMFAVVVGWVTVYRAACAPPSKTPAAVTVFEVPTVLSANVAVAPDESMVTVSLLTTPTSDAPVNDGVAFTDLSYSLLAAVMPVIVSVFVVTAKL